MKASWGAACLLLALLPSLSSAGTNEEGKKFLEENKGRPGVVTLKSGLQYKVIRKGTGQYYPKKDSPCSCHYAGTTAALTPDMREKDESEWREFDSSYKRGAPTSFAPDQVITGWTEAMQLMVEGDKWEMYIPSELGYGDRGSGAKIRGGEVLVFRMEILKILGGKVPAGPSGAAGAAPAKVAQVAMDSMDKLHGPSHANFANLTAHSWNIFRYVGDYLHLGGILLLLVTICKNKSLKGISRSTQVLYFLVFITRYLDLFEHSQTAYLVFFKLTYIGTSMIVLFLFSQLTATYERRNDTCNLAVITLPCATAALLLTNEYSMLEVLWTFSEFVEGFAMVPQYVFCYREKNSGRDWGASLYVISLGGYRVFYALNWIYKKIQMPHYSDIQSWIGGIIEIMFFFDFLNFRFTGNSMLRSVVLTVDTKINEISEKVEMKVLGTSSRQERTETEGGEMRRRRKAEEVPMEDV